MLGAVVAAVGMCLAELARGSLVVGPAVDQPTLLVVQPRWAMSACRCSSQLHPSERRRRRHADLLVAWWLAGCSRVCFAVAQAGLAQGSARSSTVANLAFACETMLAVPSVAAACARGGRERRRTSPVVTAAHSLVRHRREPAAAGCGCGAAVAEQTERCRDVGWREPTRSPRGLR